mmetsp:Transcript_34399/g.66610  ORF Transcript_34399/g.66610 Transcript_34399/m.66610 type:complete len:236 (-) Transcript_34399:149-856(-)
MDEITFDPPLSQKHTEALDMFGMGVHNKVVLRFAEKDVFWPEDAPQLNCTTPSVQWQNLHALGNKGVIVAHLWPPLAEEITGMSDDEVTAHVVDLLFTHFGPKTNANNATTAEKKSSHGNNVDVDVDVDGTCLPVGDTCHPPEPAWSVVTRWHEDPFSRGSYSYHRPAPLDSSLRTHAEAVDALSEAHGEGAIWFAGEAITHRSPQCVYGAFLSGLRAGKAARTEMMMADQRADQ